MVTNCVDVEIKKGCIEVFEDTVSSVDFVQSMNNAGIRFPITRIEGT